MSERQAVIRTCDRCGRPCNAPVLSTVELNLTLGETAAWTWVKLAGERLDLCEPCVHGFVRWWAAAQTASTEPVARPPELPSHVR